MRASGDSELGEDPVEMGTDRAMGQEELLPDLLVAHAGRRHTRDLEFLRRERVRKIVRALATRLPRSAQFLACTFGPRSGAQAVERIPRLAQRAAGVGRVSLSPQPG